MDLPPPPYTTARTIYLNSVAQFSECGNKASLIMTWTLYEAAGQAVVLTGMGSSLKIDPGIIKAGQTYEAVLIARLAGYDSLRSTAILNLENPRVVSEESRRGIFIASMLHPVMVQVVFRSELSSLARRSFQVEESNLVASIAGGSRAVSRDNSALQLDASPSYDPDACSSVNLADGTCTADTDLRVSWACARGSDRERACRERGTGEIATFPEGVVVTVDIAALEIDEEDSVIFSALISKGARFEETNVVFPLLEGAVLDLSIDTLFGNAERVAFVAAGPGLLFDQPLVINTNGFPSHLLRTISPLLPL
jgi:hypothetical protein